MPGIKLNDFECSGINISGFFPKDFNPYPIAKEHPIASPSGPACVTIAIFSAFFISLKILSSVIYFPLSNFHL